MEPENNIYMGNACYHPTENPLSSRLLSKNRIGMKRLTWASKESGVCGLGFCGYVSGSVANSCEHGNNLKVISC
jgi:hypothetical protein